MGDRVCVLKEGILQQVDTPRNLYTSPANVFVAWFIGSPAMNLFSVAQDGTNVYLGEDALPVPEGILSKTSEPRVTLGIRPEDFDLVETGGLQMEVELIEELGADAYIFGTPRGVETAQPVIARVDGRRPPAKGEVVRIAPSMEHVHVFDTQTGLRLNGEIPEHTPHAQLADVEALQDDEE